MDWKLTLSFSKLRRGREYERLKETRNGEKKRTRKNRGRRVRRTNEETQELRA